jgi:hypothetical protein
MTCTEEIPPLGMPEKIQVVFVNNSYLFAETCIHACMFELKVPTTHDVRQDFKAAFMEACANHTRFGAI